MTERCKNCRFADKSNAIGDLSLVECCRFPPRAGDKGWPIVRQDQWCGEWMSSDSPVER